MPLDCMDLETGSVYQVPAPPRRRFGHLMALVKRFLLRPITAILIWWATHGGCNQVRDPPRVVQLPNSEKGPLQIEDYPNGYPRFSALLTSHESFLVCRRFTYLRSRLLLTKQIRLSILEKQLAGLDRDEEVLLRLGSYEEDDNVARQQVLDEIEKRLADYDLFIDQTRRKLAFESPRKSELTNLRNWLDGHRCIARAETEFITSPRYQKDLMKIANVDDNALTQIASLVDHVLVWIYCGMVRPILGRRNKGVGSDEETHRPQGNGASRDPNVHIFNETAVTRACRIVMIPFITILLMAPVVICNYLESLWVRLLAIVLSTSTFISVLSGLAKVRTVELVIAGATYTTVLVVFLSNN